MTEETRTILGLAAAVVIVSWFLAKAASLATSGAIRLGRALKQRQFQEASEERRP